MNKFLMLTNVYTNGLVGIAVDAIQSWTAARRPNETIIRFKQGGYVIVKEHVNFITAELRNV